MAAPSDSTSHNLEIPTGLDVGEERALVEAGEGAALTAEVGEGAVLTVEVGEGAVLTVEVGEGVALTVEEGEVVVACVTYS